MPGDPAGAGFAGWLEASALSLAMREHLWLYPIVEILHIGGFVVLVGAAAMFDLRLLGFGKTLPVAALGRHLLPWSVASLGVVAPAGLLLFSAHPRELAANPVFLSKLALIVLGGINAAAFHLGAYRSVAAWNEGVPAPLAARCHALASLAIWSAVICCGRLLAYT